MGHTADPWQKKVTEGEGANKNTMLQMLCQKKKENLFHNPI